MIPLDAITDDIADMIGVRQYFAATHLMLAYRKRLTWTHYDAIFALADHARLRLNFNFDAAEKALAGVDAHLPDAIAPRVVALREAVHHRDDAWVLAEELFTVEMEMSIGDYRDALTAVITCREGLMRYAVQARGVQLNAARNRIDADWLAGQHALRSALEAMHISDRSILTASALDRILGHYAQDDDGLRAICKRLDKFDALNALRNDSIHQHAGVSQPALAEAYPGGITALMRDLHRLYEDITGRAIDGNPYDEINLLILDLMRL
jgi:hypothetical protein